MEQRLETREPTFVKPELYLIVAYGMLIRAIDGHTPSVR